VRFIGTDGNPSVFLVHSKVRHPYFDEPDTPLVSYIEQFFSV
jgi:hypothetical protein